MGELAGGARLIGLGAAGVALGGLRGGPVRLARALPDQQYYLETKARLGGKQATLTIARKLIRRAHHTLRELGDEALQPVSVT